MFSRLKLMIFVVYLMFGVFLRMVLICLVNWLVCWSEDVFGGFILCWW